MSENDIGVNPAPDDVAEEFQEAPAQPDAEQRLASEVDRRKTEFQEARHERDALLEKLTAKREPGAAEEPWKQSYNPDSGKGLRNSRGHFSTMDKEQAEAIEENERLNAILKRIADIKKALDEISADLPGRRNEETWKKTFDESKGERMRNSRGEYTTTDKEQEEALRMNEEMDHGKTLAELPASSVYKTDEDGFDLSKTETTEPPAEPAVPDYDPESSDYEPKYGPDDLSYVPGYDPTDDPYLPEYVPDIPEYIPAPEIVDWRREALTFLNELARRDQERAIQRYGGFRPFAAASGFLRMTNGLARRLSGGRVNFAGLDRVAERIEQTDERISEGVIGRTIGRVRAWFDKIGSRTILTDQEINEGDIDENLDRVANFRRAQWWKKPLKIGAKLMGGFGVAAATIMTGGIGAPTALLWAGGMKEGFDSIGQTVEHLGWGRRRAALELESQGQETEQINELKARVADRGTPMTREEFIGLLNNIIGSEADLTGQEERNITGERRGQMIRSLSTTAATIGVGLFAGVPFGKVNYDNDNTALAQSARAAVGDPSLPIMQESHRGFWNLLNRGQFGYEHNSTLSAVRDSLNGAVPQGVEYDKMQTIINFLNNEMKGNFGMFDLTPTSVYGQTAHILGNNLPLADYLKLAAVPAYLAAETLRHFARRPEQEGGGDYYASYDEHYSPYGPDRYDGGAGGSGGHRPEGSELPDTTDEAELASREKSACDTYLEHLGGSSPDYVREVESAETELPPMAPECRFAVCVPAAYSEHRIIYDYLSSMVGQKNLDGSDLNPSIFEVNVFVNGPENKQDEIDQTVAEIERFRAEHPEMHVNVIHRAYGERQTIGYLRKFINDSALMRAEARPDRTAPLNLVSHDADIQLADEQYFAKALKAFEDSPDTKILAGQEELPDEVKERYPYIWAARRLWQFIDAASAGQGEPRRIRKALGTNAIIRAEAYARVDGYRPTDRVAEDLSLGNRIENFYGNRGQSGHNTIANFRPRAIISPRRDLQTVDRNRPIIGGYEDFQDNDSVREGAHRDRAAEITPDNPQVFLRNMNREASSQFNSLFMNLFHALNNSNPEMVRARRERLTDDQIQQIELRNLQGEVGRQAMAEAEKTFRKACSYLGIGKIDINVASGGRYECHIREWNKLKEGLHNPG